MSRYHPVRPKKPKHEPATQPETPASAEASADRAPMPTEAQMETVARDRFKAVFDEVYKMRDGDALEASIARWKQTLELYDQEQQAVKAKKGEGHRWTVSPTVALRIDMHLEKLLERREQLKIECHAEARQIMTQFMRDHGPKDDSLCPPKQSEPATRADSRPPTNPNPAPPKGGSADAEHIAA
jgi:hypothetical protein